MSLPRMSWHIGDYKKDTGHLRAAGHGAYFLLSMHYWSTGGLPDDDKQLAAIACMTDREWKAHRATLLAFFKGEGVWRHKRIDRELAEAQAKYEKRVAAGKKGGDAKATAQQNSSNARPMLEQTASNAVAEPYQPITDKEEKMQAPPALDEDGDLFRRGKQVLGSDAGSLIAKLKKERGGVSQARAVIEQAATKENPREYVGRVLAGPAKARAPNGELYPAGII